MVSKRSPSSITIYIFIRNILASKYFLAYFFTCIYIPFFSYVPAIFLSCINRVPPCTAYIIFFPLVHIIFLYCMYHFPLWYIQFFLFVHTLFSSCTHHFSFLYMSFSFPVHTIFLTCNTIFLSCTFPSPLCTVVQCTYHFLSCNTIFLSCT